MSICYDALRFIAGGRGLNPDGTKLGGKSVEKNQKIGIAWAVAAAICVVAVGVFAVATIIGGAFAITAIITTAATILAAFEVLNTLTSLFMGIVLFKLAMELSKNAHYHLSGRVKELTKQFSAYISDQRKPVADQRKPVHVPVPTGGDFLQTRDLLSVDFPPIPQVRGHVAVHLGVESPG